MNIHHVNQADAVNLSVESPSDRIMYLKKDNRKTTQVRHMVGNKRNTFKTLKPQKSGRQL